MLTIRRAVAADSLAIYEVHISAITKVCAADYTTEEIAAWTAGKTPDKYVPAILANDFFVASQSEVVVGFSEFNPQSQELVAVYVHPDFVRRGIGAALLGAAEAAARARRVSRVHLHASLNAVAFYEASGYAVERYGALQLHSGTALRCAVMHKTFED